MAVDVPKKIFVCCDAKRRRSILPFDGERAAGIDVGNGGDRTFIGFDIAIAPNTHPPASNRQNDAYGEKYDSELLHVKYASCCFDAAMPRFGFRKIHSMRRKFRTCETLKNRNSKSLRHSLHNL